MKLIGLTGKAGSGKDTAADYLVQNYGFIKYSFAGPLKEMLKVIGVDCDNRDTKERKHPVFGVSPRRMAQTLGTEWMRECVSGSGWLLLADQFIKTQIELSNLEDVPTVNGIVISDVRFENEARFLREKGGVLIHVWRDTAPVEGHASEAGVALTEEDRCLLNDKEIVDMERRMSHIMDAL